MSVMLQYTSTIVHTIQEFPAVLNTMWEGVTITDTPSRPCPAPVAPLWMLMSTQVSRPADQHTCWVQTHLQQISLSFHYNRAIPASNSPITSARAERLPIDQTWPHIFIHKDICNAILFPAHYRTCLPSREESCSLCYEWLKWDGYYLRLKAKFQ